MKVTDLTKGTLILHPTTDDVVEVIAVRQMKTRAKINFRAKGQRGAFYMPLDTEVKPQ